jgi:hypothetical protein
LETEQLGIAKWVRTGVFAQCERVTGSTALLEVTAETLGEDSLPAKSPCTREREQLSWGKTASQPQTPQIVMGEVIRRMSGDTILIQDAMGEKASFFLV